jgi:hypothetical protein
MGYNGNNRVGLPQRGSGNRAFKPFGIHTVFGLITSLFTVFGPFSALAALLFILDSTFRLFCLFILPSIFIFTIIICIITHIYYKKKDSVITLNDESYYKQYEVKYFNNSNMIMSNTYDKIEDGHDMSNRNNYGNLEMSDIEIKLCDALYAMPIPPPNCRIAKKCFRIGSKVKNKHNDHIMYIINHENNLYKCFDYTTKTCLEYTKEDFYSGE